MILSQICAPGGPVLSRIALGAWRISDAPMTADAIRAWVHEAAGAGVTTVDHADIYGGYTCQERYGEAVGGDKALRDRLQLISKCGIKLISSRRPAHKIKSYDTSERHIVASVETSLQELRTDRLDLLLIHRPDPMMDADQVAAAFSKLRDSGKVLHFGVSNFTPSQFDLLASRLPFPLVTNQVQFSTLHTAPLYDGTFDQCQRLRLAPMAWSPLDAGKLLTDPSERALRVRQALEAAGKELDNATLEQTALAWVLSHPARIIPVVGTTNRERLRSCVAAAGLHVAREQWFRILEASAGRSVP